MFRTALLRVGLALAGAVSALATPQLTLHYDRPAVEWVEALPVGNGRLGAMVFGNPGKERLQLNDVTIWSSGPQADTDRPEAYKNLPEIRRLLVEGDYKAASDLTASTMTGARGNFDWAYSGSYQTLGDLRFDHALPGGEPAAYRRWLDLDTAVAGVSFQLDGATYTRETFSSAPDRALVTRIASTRKDGVSFTLGLSRRHSASTTALGSDTLVMTGNTDYKHNNRNGHEKGNVDYQVRVRVLTKGGSVRAEGDHLVVKDADEALVILACATSYALDYKANYRGPAPEPIVTQQLAAAVAKPYERLLADHVADHQKYFRRVTLDLGSTDAAQAPTDERLKAFQNGADDPSLASLFFQFGRYLLISSSRPDNPLPSNSQGIWGDGFDLPWKADYKSNINYQMNYWPAGPANLAELFLPAARLNLSVVEPGRKTAKEYFDAPGWMLAVQTNAWGYTSPGSGMPWGTFFVGGAWYGRMWWDHYAFTRDREFLKSVYPAMKESVQAHLAMLTPDAQGRLVTAPSTSPENKFRTPGGKVSQVDAGAAMERQIIHDLFTNYLLAARTLGVDADFRQTVSAARGKIRPPEIGKAGQLMEWSGDWDLNAPRTAPPPRLPPLRALPRHPDLAAHHARTRSSRQEDLGAPRRRRHRLESCLEAQLLGPPPRWRPCPEAPAQPASLRHHRQDRDEPRRRHLPEPLRRASALPDRRKFRRCLRHLRTAPPESGLLLRERPGFRGALRPRPAPRAPLRVEDRLHHRPARPRRLRNRSLVARRQARASRHPRQRRRESPRSLRRQDRRLPARRRRHPPARKRPPAPRRRLTASPGVGYTSSPLFCLAPWRSTPSTPPSRRPPLARISRPTTSVMR